MFDRVRRVEPVAIDDRGGTALRSGVRRVAAVGTLTGILLGLLVLTAAASAHELNPYQLQSHFDGHDAAGGAFTSEVASLTMDESTQRLYAMDRKGPETIISQFDPSGAAAPFAALNGSSTIFTGQEFGYGPENPSIQFDWTPFHGGLYAVDQGGFRAYNPDGSVRFGPSGSNGSSDVAPIVPDGSVVFTSTGGGTLFHQASTGGQAFAELFYELPTKIELGADGYYYYTEREFFEHGLFKGRDIAECHPRSVACQRVAEFAYDSPRDLTIDRSTGNLYVVEAPYNRVVEYASDGRPLNTFGLPEGAFTGLFEARGIAVDETTKDVYVTSLDGSPRIDVFHPGAAVTVPDVTTEPADHPDDTSAVLKAVVNADNVPTTECKFEWGPTSQYTNTLATEGVQCEQGNVLTGTGDHEVTLKVNSLTVGGSYHYRVAARNANGYWTYGKDQFFEGSTPPTSPAVLVDQVNTDGARLTSNINPHGGTTSYHFEVGTQDCASNSCQSVPVPDGRLSSNLTIQAASATIHGLEPDTTYFVRLVATNGAGTASPSTTFHTFPGPPEGDNCPNAQVRQQTSASLLPDCRAYELVSAANAGGYDVESPLVPGQSPFSSYPAATGRVLYGLHFGSLPGVAGNPTNDGLDPYVAERGTNGWTSRYVGLPSNGMADPSAFGSPLLGADDQLGIFAFGGEGICEPCFAGHGTNLPVRVHGGPPIPGMTGSLPTGEIQPEGEVRRYLSADGSHLVFGSSTKFEEGGAEGALTIYEHSLAPGGGTEVVSTDGEGHTISGAGVAALDVSSDGTRVLVGKLASTDAAGNRHYHLYLHTAGVKASADLTPGPTSSALFDGMTGDGSRVFFTTTDKLENEDGDNSADIYEAAVSPSGTVSLRLVSTDSTGAPSNDDGCTPPGTPNSWNSVSGPGHCDAVAPAGGAGIARDSGTFYFFSPELLDGTDGEAGQPNLYVVPPGGHLHFVATIDSSSSKPGPPPPEHPLVKANFATAAEPEAMTVDQATGDVYVVQQSEGKVTRFDSTGAQSEFSATGSNSISGFSFLPLASDLAIDDSQAGPLKGDIYVASGSVTIWSQTGAKLGQLNGSGTSKGSFEYACGVAVDPTGVVYVSDTAGYVWKYTPNSTSGELTDADYTVTGIQTPGFTPCSSAADGDGHLYVSGYPDGPLKRFSTNGFAGGTPPGVGGTTVSTVARALETDQQTHEAYVSEGNQIDIFDEAGDQIATIDGSGVFSGARGVAVRSATGHVYVSSKSSGMISEFGSQPAPFNPIDNPALVNGVLRTGVFSYGDFQVTRDGRYAAFSSTVPLTGYQNLGNSEVFRYDADQDRIDCASCATTLAPAKSGVRLSPYGLNLSEDGRVFFTTREGLVLSDTNERDDAYEWQGGDIRIISSGRGLSDSALLGTSEDGKDAFFFTRDQLVTTDENGGAVKIYDAREGGGFLQLPAPQPCAASDECHGAGTIAPPPPNVNSLHGPGENGYEPPQTQGHCRKGFVRLHGRCVKKHRHHRRHGHHRKHHG
jgi:hypothetical protein